MILEAPSNLIFYDSMILNNRGLTLADTVLWPLREWHLTFVSVPVTLQTEIQMRKVLAEQA